MGNQYKKVIYYYYDEAGNRRPIAESNSLIDNYDDLIEKFPRATQNLYALAEGVEFKLL